MCNQPKNSNQKSRRQFLQHTSVAVTGAAVVSAAAPHVHAGENSTIKLALVGCGGRGTGAIVNALATSGGPIRLHAMADLFEHRMSASLGQLSKRFPKMVDVPKDRQFIGFDAYKKAIDSLDPGDVVLLTTHAAFRPLMFEYAVAKGVNVFMEKSFGTDAPSVRRLLRAAEVAEQKNLKVGVGFMWRHSEARQAVIERIHDGQIGDVQMMRIYRVHGPVQCPPRKEEENELAFQIQHPTSFTWVSSGFFIDYHCHNIDVACWAKGAWPVSAQGMGGRTSERAGNQFDHYSVEYTFADGVKLLSYSRHMSGCWNTYADYVHGTKGSAIVMTNLSQPKPRIYRGQNMVKNNLEWEYGKPDCDPYNAEWQVLVDAIRQDKPHNEAKRAGAAQFAGLLGRIATHTGQFVTWDEVINSDFQFVDDIDNMDYTTTAPVHNGADGLYEAPTPGVWNEI